MPSRLPTKRGTRKLSEVARHLVLPSGIVSSGYPAVQAQCAKMGIVHDEWQAGLGRAVLAKRADGLYAAGIGGVFASICRQVGKTFTFGSLIFALCVLVPGLKVLWTAHRTRTSDETFRSLKGLAARKLVAPYVENVRSANGQQEIEFKNGSRILFGARESGFGRGFDDVDIIVFDETQILTQKALDDMIPATNVAPNPLIVYIGTPPKPSDPSEVFAGRRREALAVAEERSSGVDVENDMLFVEISADPDADIHDRKQWAKANPSYPHRTPENAILRMLKNLGAESFRREGLGVWDEDSASGEFPNWGSLSVEPPSGLDRMVVCMDVRMGVQQSVSLGVVGGSERGAVAAVGLYEQRAGAQWSDDDIVGWVAAELSSRELDTVVVDEYGENGPLIPLLEQAGLTVLRLNTRDMRNACMGVHTAFLNGQVGHLNEEPLNRAVAGAVRRKSGEGWLWSRLHSTTDIGPLMAVAGAWWVFTSTDSDYDVMDSFF